MSEPKWIHCPRCQSEDLTLTETHEEHGTVGPRRFTTDEHGRIIVDDPFDFEPGDPVRVVLWCEACGHEWRSRRPIEVVFPRVTPARAPTPDAHPASRESEQAAAGAVSS